MVFFERRLVRSSCPPTVGKPISGMLCLNDCGRCAGGFDCSLPQYQNGLSHDGLSCEIFAMNCLDLERVKEPLGASIIVTVAFGAHAALLTDELLVSTGTILAASI